MIQHFWDVKHYRNGKLIWEETYKHNTLANQGAEAILEAFYRSNVLYAAPQFYVRLCNYSPVVSDTLATIQNEPATNGYAPQLVPASSVGFPYKDIAPDGNYRLTSEVVVFTASGGSIGPVMTAYIATTSDNTGKLIGYLPLSMQRTILDGDSMTYQFYVEEGNA